MQSNLFLRIWNHQSAYACIAAYWNNLSALCSPSSTIYRTLAFWRRCTWTGLGTAKKVNMWKTSHLLTNRPQINVHWARRPIKLAVGSNEISRKNLRMLQGIEETTATHVIWIQPHKRNHPEISRVGLNANQPLEWEAGARVSLTARLSVDSISWWVFGIHQCSWHHKSWCFCQPRTCVNADCWPPFWIAHLPFSPPLTQSPFTNSSHFHTFSMGSSSELNPQMEQNPRAAGYHEIESSPWLLECWERYAWF